MKMNGNYVNSFIVSIFLSFIPCFINAAEDSEPSAYLCIHSEFIFPSSKLNEKVITTKHLIASSSLLVTDGERLFFKRLFKNEGLFYSPVKDLGDSQFNVLTFENSVLAISTKIEDNVKNERYLCELHNEVTNLLSHQGHDWPAYLTK